MVKNLIFMLLLCTSAVGQDVGVKIFEIENETWYGLNKPAAQNIIKKAVKGTYFDSYVLHSNKILEQVVEAKLASDQSQIELQNSLAKCRYVAINSQEDSIRLKKELEGLNELNKKFKQQRWYLVGGILLLTVITASSL